MLLPSTRFMLIYSFFILGCSACVKEVKPAEGTTTKPLFDSLPVIVPVTPLIRETSGIADSKKNPGYLWVEEDGGNPPQLTLLKHNGTVQKTIYVKGATNRDWEDIVLYGNNLYVGEIGDNNAAYPDYAFYVFPEPDLSIDTVSNFQKISFKYPDGSHDAEAFLVDPSTSDIYIITKRDNPSRIYKLAAPLSTGSINIAQAVGNLNYNGVVSATLSPDAKEIIVKTYFGLNYYAKSSSSDKLEEALQKTPKTIPYQTEPQGEAVCFAINGSGYFTLSESVSASPVQLYFYKRN